MFESKFFLWLGMIFPLVFSAGPANIAMASLGGQFGLGKSMPFILGINLIVLLEAFAIGLGIGDFIKNYPVLFKYIKYAGSLYLIYLAYKLFYLSQANSKESKLNPPSFFDGVILQLLNIKVMTVIFVMFSQFLDINSNQILQVSILSFGISILTTCATISWAFVGASLSQKFMSKKSVKFQGYIFGTMLICVALWMLF